MYFMKVCDSSNDVGLACCCWSVGFAVEVILRLGLRYMSWTGWANACNSSGLSDHTVKPIPSNVPFLVPSIFHRQRMRSSSRLSLYLANRSKEIPVYNRGGVFYTSAKQAILSLSSNRNDLRSLSPPPLVSRLPAASRFLTSGNAPAKIHYSHSVCLSRRKVYGRPTRASARR